MILARFVYFLPNQVTTLVNIYEGTGVNNYTIESI